MTSAEWATAGKNILECRVIPEEGEILHGFLVLTIEGSRRMNGSAVGATIYLDHPK